MTESAETDKRIDDLPKNVGLTGVSISPEDFQEIARKDPIVAAARAVIDSGTTEPEEYYAPKELFDIYRKMKPDAKAQFRVYLAVEQVIERTDPEVQKKINESYERDRHFKGPQFWYSEVQELITKFDEVKSGASPSTQSRFHGASEAAMDVVMSRIRHIILVDESTRAAFFKNPDIEAEYRSRNYVRGER